MSSTAEPVNPHLVAAVPARSSQRLVATMNGGWALKRCRLDGGEINLVATQMVLDREHPNRVVFDPDAGLDPTLDLALLGSQLRAVIQGRASAWQDNIILTYGGRKGGSSGASCLMTEACLVCVCDGLGLKVRREVDKTGVLGAGARRWRRGAGAQRCCSYF